MATQNEHAEKLIEHLPYAPRRQMLGNEVYEEGRGEGCLCRRWRL